MAEMTTADAFRPSPEEWAANLFADGRAYLRYDAGTDLLALLNLAVSEAGYAGIPKADLLVYVVSSSEILVAVRGFDKLDRTEDPVETTAIEAGTEKES